MNLPPSISLLHATYGRPEKALAAMRSSIDRARSPSCVEYIFAVNNDDNHTAKVFLREENIRPASIVFGPFNGSVAAWNAAAKTSRGELLIQMQDDLELPDNWDAQIVDALLTIDRANPWYVPAVIGVSDGYRKDGLLCTAICTRTRYNDVGYFLHPGYLSVYSDDDFTYEALRDAKAGKVEFINGSHITFLHRHHYHDKSIPMDATYERENSSEAYLVGGDLFSKRHPDAATDGLVTWK